jgi:hypothetical protein
MILVNLVIGVGAILSSTANEVLPSPANREVLLANGNPPLCHAGPIQATGVPIAPFG